MLTLKDRWHVYNELIAKTHKFSDQDRLLLCAVFYTGAHEATAMLRESSVEGGPLGPVYVFPAIEDELRRFRSAVEQFAAETGQ